MGQDMLVQRFVEHVDAKGRVTTHRVLVMFGKALYAILSRGTEPRAPLDWLAESPARVAAANAAGERHRQLLFDKDIIAYAESAATAFPDVPVLAVDILRETGSGDLVITEVNASGARWHLSSDTGKARYTAAFRASLYKQFNALDRAAELLIEKARAEAI